MKTRIVHTKIWQDEPFCQLSRSSKLLFLYLLTCQSNNIISTFELSDRVICFDTGLTQSELETGKEELKNKVIFYKGWIKITNSNKYNNYITNPKLKVAEERELNLIPIDIRDYFKGYDTSIHTSIYTTNNHKSKIINNNIENSVNENDFEEIAKQMNVSVAYVKQTNEKMNDWCKSKGKSYKDKKAALRNWIRGDKNLEKAPKYIQPQNRVSISDLLKERRQNV